ncbi:hypothetical protein [Treponema pectinovorum]|uniref:hypothetical protein n=1 Tax=Treponema pectinovorum TaxID=164 RepID=UPI003D8BF188
MSKKIKNVAVLAIALCLCTGAAVAQNFNEFENPKNSPEPQFQNRKNFCFEREDFGRRDLDMLNDEIIIGKIKSINLSTSQIVVTNSDGKDVTVEVSPFTFINFNDDFKMKKQPRANFNFQETKKENDERVLPSQPKKIELSELAKGDWVMISTFNTETKTLSAFQIVAQKIKQNSKDIENAK